MDNSQQIRQFMRDIYVFLQQEMSILYRQSYEAKLVVEAAREEEAFLYKETLRIYTQGLLPSMSS